MATSLTFVSLLKFSQDSYHTAKGRQIPSSTERDSTRGSARTTNQAHQPIKRGLLQVLQAPPTRECRHGRWSNKGPRWQRQFFRYRFLKSSVDRLATPLGRHESLAFRAFDKIVIFGHWVSKAHKLALAFGAFLLKKASTIS